MNKWVSVAVVVALGMGCGGKDTTPGIAGGYDSDAGTGGRHSTGGKSGTSLAGGGSAGTSTTAGGTTNVGGTSAPSSAGQASLAPSVTIDSPAAVPNPDNGTIILGTDTDVKVLCTANKSSASGATDVLASSVQIAMAPSAGQPTVKQAAQVSGTSNQYSATFSAANVASGAVTFKCTASDQSSPPNVASATVSTFVDQGPLISVSKPAADAAFALKSVVSFAFQVTPQELLAGDQGAQISQVTLNVAGRDITLSPPDSTGTYKVDVNFGDTTLFTQSPSGTVPVVVTAVNGRTSPGPATTKNSYYIVLDGTPPQITIDSPPPNTVIGGVRTLQFTIVDPLSGVDLSTVVVNLGSSQAIPYIFKDGDPAWTMSSNATTGTWKFTFAFDSNKFDSTDSQVSLSVNASDLAGNATKSTTNLYYLDNIPPFVSLDPPNIRLEKPTTSGSSTYYCSAPFDPLGPKAPGNGMIVNSFEFYRAFAWDLTNGKPSQSIYYYSGVDPANVHLYVQPDPTKRVIFDQTGDGVCDAIDESVKQAPLQPYLLPVVAAGSADNNPADYTSSPDISADSTICNKDTTVPQRLCTQQASDMTVAVHQLYAGQTTGNDAAIYAVNVVKDGLQCTGSDWDITSLKPAEGWVCVAAEAYDGVGNIGISAPIAVCFDDESTSYHPPCATGSRWSISTMTPPTCITDGCKPRSRSLAGDLDPVSGMPVDLNLGAPIPFVIRYRQ